MRTTFNLMLLEWAIPENIPSPIDDIGNPVEKKMLGEHAWNPRILTGIPRKSFTVLQNFGILQY